MGKHHLYSLHGLGRGLDCKIYEARDASFPFAGGESHRYLISRAAVFQKWVQDAVFPLPYLLHYLFLCWHLCS